MAERSRRCGLHTFREAFIAVLRLSGCEAVVTRNSEQHDRFGAAVEVLRDLQRQDAPGALDLPRAPHPTAVTGLYRDIDAALLTGHGLARWLGDGVVSISIPEESARECLDSVWGLSAEQQDVLRQMAEAFMAYPPAMVAR